MKTTIIISEFAILQLHSTAWIQYLTGMHANILHTDNLFGQWEKQSLPMMATLDVYFVVTVPRGVSGKSDLPIWASNYSVKVS